MPGSDTNAQSIAKDIEHYLGNHPSAADTADGIRRCWLSSDWVEAPMHRIEEALWILEARGVVVRREVLGGAVLYSARMH